MILLFEQIIFNPKEVKFVYIVEMCTKYVTMFGS